MSFNRNVFAATVGLALVSASTAFACTQEDIAAKQTEMTTKIQELAAADPAKLQEFMAEAQKLEAEIATSPEEICDKIDALLETLED